MGLNCKWCPSPLLQSQFLTFEGYCPLLFVQLHWISTSQHVISAKQPVFIDACSHIHQPAAIDLTIPRWGAQQVLGLSQGLPRDNSIYTFCQISNIWIYTKRTLYNISIGENIFVTSSNKFSFHLHKKYHSELLINVILFACWLWNCVYFFWCF